MKKHHQQRKNNPKKTIIEGRITLTSKAVGYVRPAAPIKLKNLAKLDEIEIDPGFLNTALHGDTVKILLHPIRPGRKPTGEVEDIIVRSKAGFAGTLEKREHMYFLSPDDPKLYTEISIPSSKIHGAKQGDKIFVRITDWSDPRKTPQGEVVKVLGKPHENEAEMQAISLEKGFSADFPKEVKDEARHLEGYEIPQDEIKKRRDFRQIPTFTIDPEDAKDFDDALSLRELPDGTYEIGVHIADVSHFVRPSKPLDKEALRRGTSVYLVDRTIPMLPEVLSNDLCSLKPLVDRLSMSAVLMMDKDARILDTWYGKTVIHSDKRFTYEEAQGVLDAGMGPYHTELKILNTLAKKLTARRKAMGALTLDQEEIKFKLDEKGVPIHVYTKIRQDTNKLIEEFMLLANRKVAEFISGPKGKGTKEKVFVYRVHDVPDREKVADLIFFLKKLGYHLKTEHGKLESKSLNALIEKLEGKEEKNTIMTAIIRTMAKALYSTKNIGHYGLAFRHYTHFTSPIRRYPDLIVHRLLHDYLEGKKIGKERWHEYETVSNFSSMREKDAQDAERASIKYKQVEYMSYRIGQIFDGVITGVTDWGIYIEEKETRCEGMVKLRDLGDDFYVLDEKQMLVYGRKTNKKFRVGDKVRIKVANTNLDKKIIDYVLV